MNEKKQYIFGPVPSRRLGLSLGVDIVPLKVCTLDCVYCQLGATTEKSTQRKDYAPVDAVLDELTARLSNSPRVDFVTISGSGEPTLHIELGQIIERIKEVTDIPVALLTNSTLLTDDRVRADCVKADVILPSLDAGDEPTFRKLNRPIDDISIENLINGLCALRDEFTGPIWLEVFLVKGLNTAPEQIAEIKTAVERIRPDKIQLNMAVRPTAQAHVEKLDAEQMNAIVEQIGHGCEVIADFAPSPAGKHVETSAECVLSMLKRRPCSLDDVSAGLGISPGRAQEIITALQRQGLIELLAGDRVTFFKAKAGMTL